MSGIHCQGLLKHWKGGWGHPLALLVLAHSRMNAVPPIQKNTHQLKWNHRQQVLVILKQILKLCFWIAASLSAIITWHRSLLLLCHYYLSAILYHDYFIKGPYILQTTTIYFIEGSHIFEEQGCRCVSAHPVISIYILAELSVSLSLVWLTLQAPHRGVSDDSGFSGEGWDSWWLILRTVQLRERRSGRCFIFLGTGKHRDLAKSMKSIWRKL